MSTSRRFSRKLLSVVLMIGALATGVFLFGMLASLRKPPAVAPPPVRRYNVEVFDVAPARLQELIPSFGTAVADREVVISARVAGTVTDLLPDLRVGRTVSPPSPDASPGSPENLQGDMLVEIDRQLFEQQLAQIEGRLRETQSELTRLQQEQQNAARLLKLLQTDLKTAEQEYERVKGLGERGVATPSEVTRALLDFRKYEDAMVRQQNEDSLAPLRVAAAEERFQTLQADLKIATKTLADTRVLPPFAGTLAEVFVEKGQYVRVGDPLVRITDSSLVEVPLPVKLSDFRKIQALLEAGLAPAVALAPDLRGEAKWTGQVVRVAPEADERSRTIDVFVQVDNTTQTTPLLPGTFVHARIDGPVLDDVIAIPREALLGGRLMVAVRRSKASSNPAGNATAVEEAAAEEAASGKTGDSQPADPKTGQQGKRLPATDEVPFEVAVIEPSSEQFRSLQTIVVLDTSALASLAPADRKPVQIILTNLDVLTAGVPIDIQSHTNLSSYLEQLGLPVIRQLEK